MGEEISVQFDCSFDAADAWEKPWQYSENKFNLNSELAELIFHSRSTVYSHLLAIFLIENDLSDSLYFCRERKDDYRYNTLKYPFYTLVIGGVDYSNDLEIQDLLDELSTEGNSISPELQELIDEVKKSVPA